MKTAVISKTRVIVFLGAGASQALGMPTTPEFIVRLRQKWPNLNNLISVYKKYRKDIGAVREGTGPIDSEVLRDWLIHMSCSAESIESLSKTQPFDTNISRTENASRFTNTILTDFDSRIREAYGDAQPIDAYTHYSQFLRILSDCTISFVPIFTTNYDLVFESMQDFNQLNWHIETGMEKKGMRTVLNTELFTKVRTRLPTIHLFKLHGSTDWWLNKSSGQIEQISMDYTPPQHYKDLLIYPTIEKFDQVNEQPFSFFYEMLNNYLSSNTLNLCITIGYSFRDTIINTKFLPALAKGLQLLIIDPNLKKDQLRPAFKDVDIDNQVRIENIGFGNWVEPQKTRMVEVLSEEIRNAKPKSKRSNL